MYNVRNHTPVILHSLICFQCSAEVCEGWVWQGLPDFREVKIWFKWDILCDLCFTQVWLPSLLSHQPGNWHACFCPCRPARVDQGGTSRPQGSILKNTSCRYLVERFFRNCLSCPETLRGAAGAAKGHQGRVRGSDWHHLWHLKQTQARVLRGEKAAVAFFPLATFSFCQVELVQKMIDGVNTLWKEDKELVAKHA